MTFSSPAPAVAQRPGPWISVAGAAAYVLASPLLAGGTGFPWWAVAGVLAVGVVAAGAFSAARGARDHLDDLHRLDVEARELAGLAETRRKALEGLVDAQLPALTTAPSQPPLPDVGTDEVASALLVRASGHLTRVREDQHARQDAVRAAVVTLGRKVQASAHRIQEEASRMVARHPADADVLHTSMRVDHAAAQQARNAQSLAALCGEWPGQQWHQALPLADVVRGAAGRITAYQRVEVSGDPGVAVAARVVEPLIHVVAELLANATQSSPPTTQVLVSLRHVQRGAVIEIDDGGVGLDDTRLDQVREIASGRRPVGLAELGEIPQTGLPVVGAYVRRHGFRVDITESVYGGLRAIVLVPTELTEPVAPSAATAASGHLLTRRTTSSTESIPGSIPESIPQQLPPSLPDPVSASITGSIGEPVTEPLPEPAPTPLPSPLPSPLPRPAPAVDPPAADPSAAEPPARDREPDPAPAPEPTAEDAELPPLPRRRSRRDEAPLVHWPAEHEPIAETTQSAAEAGQWMGAFLSSAGRQTTPNHQDTEDR